MSNISSKKILPYLNQLRFYHEYSIHHNEVTLHSWTDSEVYPYNLIKVQMKINELIYENWKTFIVIK